MTVTAFSRPGGSMRAPAHRGPEPLGVQPVRSADAEAPQRVAYAKQRCARGGRRCADIRSRLPGFGLVGVGLVHAVVAAIVTATAMFAATNVDDAVVLVVHNVASRAGGAPKRWENSAGQYLGFGLILLVSLLAALGLRWSRPNGWGYWA